MYVRSQYKKPKKFNLGGAVILGHGETAVMRPPPGEPPASIDVPDDIPEDAAPADQVAAAIAKARNPRSEMPSLHNEAEPENVQPQRRGIVSAPVSRESMSWTGRREDRPGSIRLSAAQVEAAKIAGISTVEYAKNLIRLREEKANDPDRYGSGH